MYFKEYMYIDLRNIYPFKIQILTEDVFKRQYSITIFLHCIGYTYSNLLKCQTTCIFCTFSNFYIFNFWDVFSPIYVHCLIFFLGIGKSVGQMQMRTLLNAHSLVLI